MFPIKTDERLATVEASFQIVAQRVEWNHVNWKRGLTRLWIVGAALWVTAILGQTFWNGHFVWTKPSITVKWGDDQLSFPPDTKKETIEAELKKRKAECYADEAPFPAHGTEALGDCSKNIFASSTKTESGWEKYYEQPHATYFEAFAAIAPILLFPPLLVLIAGMSGFWIVRGFK